VLAIVVLTRGDAPTPPPPATHPALPGRPLFGGSLDDGVRYRTRGLQPAISLRAIGPQWFVYDASSPTTLVLQRREGDPAQGTERAPLLFLAFFRLPTVVDPGTGNVVPAPEDVVGWLRSNPNLGVTTVTRTRLFGGPATRLAFHIPKHPARVNPDCEYGKVSVDTAPPSLAACAAIAPSFSAPADSAGYVIVPDGPDPLVVGQLSLVRSRVGQIVRESRPIVDSVLIGR
jgi:hypothetical protein